VTAPLQLPLGGIQEGVQQKSYEVTSRDLDLPATDVEWGDPITVELEIIRQGEQLQIRGHAAARVRQPCVRCLGPAERRVRAAIAVVARPETEAEDPADVPDGMLYHDGESVDLTREVRDALFVEVPAHPVCRPECAGLCPRCGADLNNGPCACGGRRSVDPRWAALEQLQREKPEAGDDSER